MRVLRTTALVLAFVSGMGCSVALDFSPCTTNSDCPSGQTCDPTTGLCGGRPTLGPLPSGCEFMAGVDEAKWFAPDTLKLGALVSKTGDLSADGPKVQKGIELALSEINGASGVGGKTFALLVCDDGTDKVKGVEMAKFLVDRAKAPAIVGPEASSVTLAVAGQVTRAKSVVVISPSATAPGLTAQFQGFVWRTAPSDEFQGTAIAKLLLNQGFKKVGVVYREDPYGQGLATAIQNAYCADASQPCKTDGAYTALGYPDDVKNGQFDKQSQHVTTLAQDIKPDVIVLIGFYDDGIAFLKLAFDKGLKRFVLTDGTKDVKTLTEVADPDVTCPIFGTISANPAGADYDAFATRYRSKYGEDPGGYSAHAYDAAYMLAYAVAGSGKGGSVTGADVAKHLARLTGGTDKVPVGQTGWLGSFAKLQNDPTAKIDLRGASGPLDMSTAGEPQSADIEGWRFDLDAEKADKQVKSLGVLYTFDGKFVPPTFAPAATGKCLGKLVATSGAGG